MKIFARIGFAIRMGFTILLLAFGFFTDEQTASALPSFARQTGQQCAACHNGFPELTPYGRQFKLNAYAFSSNDASTIRLAALLIDSYSHTNKAIGFPLIPGMSRNDNAEMDIALFYAGKITTNAGAYIEGAYSTLSHGFALFNVDARYAGSARLFGKDMTYGVSLNNGPGNTDPWNTSQSFWSYPFESSHIAAAPVARPAIQGRFDERVFGGIAYVSWDKFVYAATGFYGQINPDTLNSLGIDTRGLSPIHGAAPYWRLAVEPAWGHSTWEFGTFGMAVSTDPFLITTAGSDHTVDAGFDTQYQYLGDHDSVSMMASYITEHLTLAASRALGFSSNSRNELHTFNVKGTYIYAQTYDANLGYFHTVGSRDQILYGAAGASSGSPNSSGWIGELNYYPFNRGGPSFWRAAGLKVGLQYTYYTQFDGRKYNYDGFGRSAIANNTLYLYTWLAF